MCCSNFMRLSNELLLLTQLDAPVLLLPAAIARLLHAIREHSLPIVIGADDMSQQHQLCVRCTFALSRV
jgi:hypothetical protein